MNTSDLFLKSNESFSGSSDEIIIKTSEVLSTQAEHLPKTVKRFLDELEDMKDKLSTTEDKKD